MKKIELSVALTCSEPDRLEFPLYECIASVATIADEIVIINGDPPNVFETDGVIHSLCNDFAQIYMEDKINMFFLPWRDSFRKNMSLLAKTAAISQCTKDYILLLDADELIHEQDYEKIKECMVLGHDAYSFRTIHFYKDYQHVKTPSDRWYNHRPKLFKNGLGIWDGYQSWINWVDWPDSDQHDVEIKREYTADLVTWDYKPVHEFSKKTKIEIFHYGWVRSPEVMLMKQNNIEKRHHPDWKEMKEWKWDMSGTEEFTGTHPFVMAERILNASKNR